MASSLKNTSQRLMEILNTHNPQLEDVRQIVENNPGLDINVDYGYGLPVFSSFILDNIEVYEFMCSKGIDWNARYEWGRTLLMFECRRGIGRGRQMMILINNPTVSTDATDDNGYTALFHLFLIIHDHELSGIFLLVKRFIASGRELFIDAVSEVDVFDPNDTPQTVIQFVEEGFNLDVQNRYMSDEVVSGYTRIIDLLKNFRDDPDNVRNKIRLEFKNALSGALFASTVFICSGYAIIKNDNPTDSTQESNAKQFFKSVTLLPMELQMTLSNFAYGINNDLIPHKIREHGFREIAGAWNQEQMEKMNKTGEKR